MKNDEQEIRDLIAEWASATSSGDEERVLRLMSDDVVFLGAGRQPIFKADFAYAQLGLRQFDLKMDAEVQEIVVMGEWAYCWSQLSVKATPKVGGEAISREGPSLSILKKHAGSWVLFRDANMLSTVSRR